MVVAASATAEAAMAVTGPRETQPASGPPPAGGPAGTRPRHGWRGWALSGVVVLLVAALVVLTVLAGAYQPIQFGGESGGSFPGLPDGTGLQSVNTFGQQQGQLYVPPRAGVFTVVESIANTGPETVTIVAVSILSPEDQQFQHASGPPVAWPLLPAGPVRAMIDTPRPTGIVRPAAGLPLGPGQEARIAIPVRLGGTCYDTQSFNTADTFYVEERFLTFTHWVALSFTVPYLFHQTVDPGEEPAKYMTCPAR
jgi:hypothetical protein